MYTSKLSHVRCTAWALGLLAAALISARAAAAAGDAAMGPTAASALAADQQLATAIRNNDAQGIESMLADDWAVVATTGGLGEGKDVFPEGIKSGTLTRKTYELADPRVRLYGDMALVTSKVKTSGTLDGKPFDVMERQTDVLLWKDGIWKCVLTHETKMATPAK